MEKSNNFYYFIDMVVIRRIIFAFLLSLLSCAGQKSRDSKIIENELSHWIQYNGIRIHYYDTHPQDKYKNLMLFLPGFNGSAYSYYRLIQYMPRHTRCVVVDFPGCGISDKPEIDYTIGYYQNFLGAFIHKLGLKNYILAAHSFGANIALYYAYHNPQQIKKLILLSPLGLKGEEGFLNLFLANSPTLVDISSALNTRLFTKIGIYQLCYHNPHIIPQDLVDSIAESSLSKDGRRALASISKNAIGRDPVDQILPQIKIPSLILWGKYDRVLPLKWAYIFNLLLIESDLEIIDDCGHVLMLEKPRKCAQIIREFIEKI